MCDCYEKKLFDTGVDVTIQRPNTITCFHHNCSQNQSAIRDFNDEKCAVKSLIRWSPFEKKNSIPLLNCYDNPGDITSDSSSNYTSSGSSRTYKFVNENDVACGCDSDEGECHDDDNNDNDNDNVSENKFKTVPKQLDKVSTFHKEKKPDIEFTLALINPDTVKHQMFIEQMIINEGFEICQNKIVQMTPEQTANFFVDKNGESSFPHFITYMSSGPIVVMVLAKYRAINDWQKLMGPEEVAKARLYFPDSIRAIFGNDEPFQNAVHGSSSLTAARREIHFFFPNFIFEPIMTGKKAERYIWDTISPTLKKGIILCCKTKPKDPLTWLADWLMENNPNKPYRIL